MGRNMKKLCCAILCICLLLINTPGSLSYAENMEQNATYTDADADTTTEAANVPETEESTQEAIGTATAEAEIDAESATETDAVLYAASEDESGGAYSLEINSQADWDSLFTHTTVDDSGWISSGTSAIHVVDCKTVEIILNSDITLSDDTTLWARQVDLQKDFFLYGNGHSIDTAGHAFSLQGSSTIAVENTHIKNGTLRLSGSGRFLCTDSQFSAVSVELYATSETEKTNITGCKFFNCPGPCINSKNAACPVSFSDCEMDNSGLLFESQYPTCRVNFSNITAKNCTGAVLGQTARGGYIIESISGCVLSTSTRGITAIDHANGGIGEITDCTITGFDTGIKLDRCTANSNIKTVTISDTTITDCTTGLHTEYLNNYENAIISNLTIEAREGASGTIGYKGIGKLTTESFLNVDYDFSKMPQIKSCHISGFDMGIDLSSACEAVISDCEISDCNSGISITYSTVAIVDTTLEARAAAAANSVGVTTNSTCFLIDCDINGFDTGSDMNASNNTTIIGCRYQNRHTNLIGSFRTYVYDTKFIGGETSINILNGISYFYDCVVEGNAATTKSGFSLDARASSLHIYSQARPYSSDAYGPYDNLKQYSDRTVNTGGSEIFNCETGIDAKSTVKIADTHIHDCVTGMKSESSTESYGNNLIEDCRDGMIVNSLFKYTVSGGGSVAQFTDIHTDTIRNCSNNGLDSSYITSNPAEWKNRLEIYDCGNYGINATGSLTTATVDIHDCKRGINITDSAGTIVLTSESKIYNSLEWNVYDNSNSYSSFIMQGSEGTLKGGDEGNIYFTNPDINHSVIAPQDLYSDDSVYYLGTADGMCLFGMNNLYGTVVIDTIDSGYIPGRRVAGLYNPNVASKMFAKREGFVISTEEDIINGTTVTYAVFAAGCDVTYDVTTNGGDTFNDESLTKNISRAGDTISGGSLPRISYLDGSDVDLTYTASKEGYEFVGWNTDQDATEGLDTLTAGRKNITLYAIYKKTAYVDYHTYDAASDYRTAVTFYNNQDEIKCKLAAYNAGGDNTFAGYVLDEDAAISSADDVMAGGDNVTVSPDGLNVYCVYEKQGQLDYLKKDGTILSTEKITVYEISSDNKKFEYTIRAGEPVEGFTFTGWKDNAGNSFAAGSTISTENNLIVLTPVYVVNEEPTPETPTPDTPTPETPTPDTPTPETPTAQPPAIESPTTEATTTQSPAGPKTGDSTNPIGVIGLGLLSLLGILVLSMKNKRKN